MNPHLELIENHLRRWVGEFPWGDPSLKEAVAYSLLGGGKRFRPVLSLLVMEACGCPLEEALPWAAAIEMVHTYSLIHDDLPCMDNDDVRRGRPTNHRVHGDALALLAGDTLLTESFGQVTVGYEDRPSIVAKLVSLLVESAGARGMITGQVLDLRATGAIDRENLRRMHDLKTGRMISAAILGAAWVAEVSESEERLWRSFGDRLGFAFQLADDLLDVEQDGGHARSWVSLAGVEQTRALLDKVTTEAMEDLDRLGKSSEGLRQVVMGNRERKV